MAQPSTPLLAVRDLAIAFDQEGATVEIVGGVSLELQAGRTLALLGESGCGKSLTALAILQLIDPPGRITRGEVVLDTGEDGPRDLLQLPAESAAMRRVRGGTVAMIFQEPGASFTPVYTVGEQIVEAIQAHEALPRPRAERLALEMLHEVGIREPRRVFESWPHQLSGGMCQRAMIALALAGRPKLLIADEPTTALDVTIQMQVLELMQALQRQHEMAILLITHDMGVVAEMADEVAVMYLGRIVEQGPVRALFGNPLHPYTRGLFASVPGMHLARHEPLYSIAGQVPEPAAWPGGCRFRGRCPAELAACGERPRLHETEAGHAVACWLHESPAVLEEHRA